MHAHSYFIDTPLSELVFKDITRNFVKLSSFSYDCLFALILESASSSNAAELSYRPYIGVFCLLIPV